MKSGNKAEKQDQTLYSSNVEDYELVGEIGSGATATVYIAKYIPLNTTVAVKIVNLEGYGNNIKEVQNEIAVMIQCFHPNVVQYYSSFVDDMDLWLVMRLLDGGSVLDIMKFSEHNGLEEAATATILKETLKALHYFHTNGHIHRDVKAGNILIDTDGTVQLADFGVSSALSLPNETKKTFAGTPCWMAPEVMEQTTGYNQKADIWSFGITAIELATGKAPHSHLSAMKVMIAVLNSAPPTLEGANHSKSLQKMVQSCLQKDPAKRPTAEQLLKHDFFKKAKGPEYIISNLIGRLPPLSERRKNKNVELRKGKDEGDDDAWDYDTSEIEKQKATPTGSKENDDEEETDSDEESGEELNLKLRMRNKKGALQDIRFAFDPEDDTPEIVSHELVEHGLVPGEDEKAICKSIQKFLETMENVVFPVNKILVDQEESAQALIGFAMLSLDEPVPEGEEN